MSATEKISTLWIVIMFNMVFADILGFMSPGFLTQVQTGVVDGVRITPVFLLVAAVLIEIPILMIFLTRILPRHAARPANFAAVVITAIFVIGGGSLSPHYIFFVSFELAALVAIFTLSLKWPEDAHW